MSAKWRALQHRHRYTYNAVIFPPYFIEALKQTPGDASSSGFYSELKELGSLNSTFAQVNHVKKVASSFESLLKNSEEISVSVAARFYLETFFLENSLPLHRTLVSALVKNNKFQSVIGDCFRALCDEYGGVSVRGTRFCVSRVALSMMSSPKLGYLVDIVEQCAILVASDILYGLNGVVSETNVWATPSPIVMEQCQEALSCMYYLLQRFPLKFKDSNSWNVLETIVTTLLNILQSAAFSRDCFVAAGVSFCAALQVCLSPEDLGLLIMEGVFHQKVFSPTCECGDLTSTVPYKESLFSEIDKFSVLSRLCLIRGILTTVSRAVLNACFVVSTDDSNSFLDHKDSNSPARTILYDGILPELCYYCENPPDSHFNFHALTVLQICLQQSKTSIQSNLHSTSENNDLISEDMASRVLRIVWNNLEDPLSQTVKQAHLIFDLFLNIQSSLHWTEGSEKIKFFLMKIAADLLCLGPRCKGRYVPLASLTKRLGAKNILDMSPDLLFETAQAYIDDDVCCAATTFLKCFLECLRDEFWTSDGIERGYTTYRGHCLPPFLHGLASGVSKLRTNLNTYALPVLLDVDVDSIFPMLAYISVGQDGEDTGLVYYDPNFDDIPLEVEQQVAVLVSLLKVSRLLALIEGDVDWSENSLVSQGMIRMDREHIDGHALVCIKGTKVKVPVKWLELALTHVDESLRIDASESLFLNPKTASLPSSLELSLLKETVPLNMRCCSTAFQMKWTGLFRKFFSRVRTALERQIKQGSWRPLVARDNSEGSSYKGNEETMIGRADDLFHFIKWLSCFLFFSCYPSAPYERKIMAMELILIMTNVWSIAPPCQGQYDSVSSESLYPYSNGFTLPNSTFLFVGSVVDSWDRLRESSFRILLHFPTPLPGISSPCMVQEAIIWAKKLICSPRVRESDAGALTLRLIFRKYVLELGWIVRASCDFVSFPPEYEMQIGGLQNCISHSPVMEYIESLIDWLCVSVEEGEKDLSVACKKSFVHGILLTLRYTFEELNWDSNVVPYRLSQLKHALEKLLNLVMRITTLALWVVSSDAWYLPEDMDDMVEGDDFMVEVPSEINSSVAQPEYEFNNSKLAQDTRQSEQVVMVGCWLAMKEVSLLLGTIIRKIPLPTSDLSKFSDVDGILTMTPEVGLDFRQLEVIGNHFLEVLLKMKHNGAIDKTRAGFTALCNRLLCSNDPRLCKLTESWMEQLMERTVAKGQVVDDLLRRSAGIPAAFTAFFLSEPEGAPKRLLPKALRWLIDVAKRSLIDQKEVRSLDGYSCHGFSAKSNKAGFSILQAEIDSNERYSKIRDEGVIPTVHAFNVLRAAFNDTNLATDTSGFSAEALIVSIRSFSSSYWEVRNSACLAYTSLVRRMIGFLNVQKRESARRALTGLEFFHRYPSLHPFLLNELKIATQLLQDRSPSHLGSNLANVVHPSLCPMLILLSRLKPSTITCETEDVLDPFLFMPFIRRCSRQSNLQIRVLASRALTGLLSNEKLPIILLNIASELPSVGNLMALSPDLSSSFNAMHGTVASSNSIHGMLLQLCSLLDTNCRNLVDFSKKDEILADLIQVLMLRSWIGSPHSCSCPILNSCFLMVLDNMLSIARTCQKSKSIGAIGNLLWKLSSECLEVEASRRPSYYDPTIAELRKQAAKSYFNCVFQASAESAEDFLMSWRYSSSVSSSLNLSEMENPSSRFLERLVRCMSDTSYEVRTTTLKWLFLFARETESGKKHHDQSDCVISVIDWTRTNLQDILMNLLEAERNHKCIYYILKILFVWNSLQYQKFSSNHAVIPKYVGVMDSGSLFPLWDKLVSLYKHTRHAKMRETLIRCMGVCVRRFADLVTSCVLPHAGSKVKVESRGRPSHWYDCINFYIMLIQEHSDSSEPVNMRKATVESLMASGLLNQAEFVAAAVTNHGSPEISSSHLEEEAAANTYARKILDAWFTCIKLLEDEDVALRKRLAVDVQKCFNSNVNRENFEVGVVPTQVEKVIELSFEHLSSTFGHCLAYFNYLCEWVLSAANPIVSGGDLVRRVFDKEIDNHHEEKLLVSQICCSHLEKMPISELWLVDKQEARDFLHTWRRRFCRQLISFIKDHAREDGEVDWFGGVGNHKDAFLPLYANLLGFYALSNCIIFNGETYSGVSLVPDFVELGETIKPLLRNPLIHSLYMCVVNAHEKVVDSATVDPVRHKAREDFVWESFYPYFLLR